MDLKEMELRFFEHGYQIETYFEYDGEMYYLRKYGTIIENIEEEDLMNLEQLEEKLISMDNEKDFKNY